MKHLIDPRARAARLAAGLTLDEAALALGVSKRYLRDIERAGFPYVLALRASRLYRSDIGSLLPSWTAEPQRTEPLVERRSNLRRLPRRPRISR